MKTGLGVIVGRFQVPDLTPGHCALINHARHNHSRVLVVVGRSPVPVTRENPLTYEHRKHIIEWTFGDVCIAGLDDVRGDRLWCQGLDDLIQSVRDGDEPVVLYGGRDSFLGGYVGKFPTQEFNVTVLGSGSEVRAEIGNNSFLPTGRFSQGVIWATQNQFPVTVTTVDVAVVAKDTGEVLLCKKPEMNKWQFIGGFSDPYSNTFEADAVRELREETGIDVGEGALRYVQSSLINDWRYRGRNKIKTLFFLCEMEAKEEAVAMDDIEQVGWFKIDPITRFIIAGEHLCLWDGLFGLLNEEGGQKA